MPRRLLLIRTNRIGTLGHRENERHERHNVRTGRHLRFGIEGPLAQKPTESREFSPLPRESSERPWKRGLPGGAGSLGRTRLCVRISLISREDTGKSPDLRPWAGLAGRNEPGFRGLAGGFPQSRNRERRPAMQGTSRPEQGGDASACAGRSRRSRPLRASGTVAAWSATRPLQISWTASPGSEIFITGTCGPKPPDDWNRPPPSGRTSERMSIGYRQVRIGGPGRFRAPLWRRAHRSQFPVYRST